MKHSNKRIMSWVLVMAMFLSVFTGLTSSVAAEGTLKNIVLSEQTATGATVTFSLQGKGDETKAIVKGSFFENWKPINMEKEENDVWAVEKEVPAGVYDFGFATWSPETKDTNAGDWQGTFPKLIIPGISIALPKEVELGKNVELKGVYYDETGAQKEVKWSTTAQDGIAIEGNILKISETAKTGALEISAAFGDKEVKKEVSVVAEAIKSPVINEDNSVTFNVENSGEKLYIVGSLNGWSIENAIPMTKTTKNGKDIFTLKMNLLPGQYEYKFVPDKKWAGDFIDPLNPVVKNTNSLLVVPGVVLDFPYEAEKGSEVALKASFMNPDGTIEANKEITWTLKEEVKGVTLKDGKLSVSSEAVPGSKVTVIGTSGSYSTERVVEILDKMYSYIINYHRYDGDHKEWDMWIWEEGKNGKAYALTKEEGDYVQATLKFPSKKISVIPRLGEWSAQDATKVIEIPEGKEAVEVWLVSKIDAPFYEKPDLEAVKPIQRKIQFTYIRKNGDYKDWNIHTWATGDKNGRVDFTEVKDGKAVAYINIGAKATNIGFKVKKGAEWDTIDQNFDRFIPTGNEVLTKAIIKEGVGEVKILPALTAPYLEDGKATFYYRDEQLYAENKMDTIEAVKLKMGDKEYDMEYVAEDEIFVYTLENIAVGSHEYSFLVTKEGKEVEVQDVKNTVDGKSVLTYKKPKVYIDTTVTPSSISYNENAVLKLNIGSDEETFREIYADLSSLGGQQKTRIDVDLKEITIAAKEDITTGIKQIPITVIDVYGNKHARTASVEVKTRQFVGKSDFDWDEARIYFMITDRFFDGDASNNDPNKENYDLSHAETYHGGDLKGITKKIDYLSELGINTIWITPIVDNIDFNKGVDFKSNQYGYHGYWAKDFTKIDEHLGDIEDLKELIDAAHEKGIKIMVDVVLNHTGYGLNTVEQWKTVKNIPTEEERAVFENMFRTENEDEVIKYSLDGLPDFKTEDPAVREKIVAWQTAWIEKSRTDKGNTIDYFRVDTVKHVENTTWMAFKNALTKIKPDFKMIGEYYGASVDSNGGYLRSGMMDSVLDFRFKGIARDFVNGKITDVQKELEDRTGKMDNTAILGQFLSSHDEDGFLYTSLSDTDKEKFKAGTLEEDKLKEVQGKQKLAASLQITSKGQPVIYYGEEIGMSGKHAGDMSKGFFNENRDMFAWDRLEDTKYNHIQEHYKKVLNIRKENSKVFSKGTTAYVAGEDATGYLVFERKYNNESILVALNTKSTSQEVTVKVPYAANTKLKDQYSGKIYLVDETQNIKMILPSSNDGGTAILVETKEPFTISAKFVVGAEEVNKLEAGKLLEVKAEVKNNTKEQESVMLIIALYDPHNALSNISYVSRKINPNESEKLNTGFKLPENVEGYTVKAFVWDGEDLSSTNQTPLSKQITLQSK